MENEKYFPCMLTQVIFNTALKRTAPATELDVEEIEFADAKLNAKAAKLAKLLKVKN